MKPGDKVIYYPIKKNELDNRHPVVEIVGQAATGKLQIKWTDADGNHKATVSAKRLEDKQPPLL